MTLYKDAPFNYETLDGLGDLYVGIGKSVIAMISTYCGYTFITTNHDLKAELMSPFLPTLIFFYITYDVGSLFM